MSDLVGGLTLFALGNVALGAVLMATLIALYDTVKDRS